MEPQLDFSHTVPLRKSYIIASSYRSGSTFVCSLLWRSGVLGAPAEYLNVGARRMSRDVMMNRLGAATPESYFAKLLQCRTSSNGVFGMKVHFPHFEAALGWYPSMRDILSPTTFIYVDRKDALAQAISMAKALQTDAWQSVDDKIIETPVYKEVSIAQCLRALQQQKLGWLQWFERNSITPFLVHYEDALEDGEAMVDSVKGLLDVTGDKPDEVRLPAVEKQGDQESLEWRDRFEQAAPDWASWFPVDLED
jgi:trehalose 2-sulfotransferase